MRMKGNSLTGGIGVSEWKEGKRGETQLNPWCVLIPLSLFSSPLLIRLLLPIYLKG